MPVLGRLLVLFTILSASCGDTKHLAVTWQDTADPTPDVFIVNVFSDLDSDFKQSVSIVLKNPATNDPVYYYTSNTQLLKDCSLAQGQVTRRDGYHSANPTQQSCLDLGLQLKSSGLFPVPLDQDFTQSADEVGAGKNGYIYTYFFYDYTSSTQGAGVDANNKVGANNRCFRLWSAELVNGVVVDSSLQPAANINLNSLKCYGF